LEYLNLDDAMKRLGGNRALYHMLLKKFLAGGDEDAIKTALAAGDHEGAVMAAHTVKGTASNLSLTALHQAAAAFEAALKAGEDPSETAEALYEVHAKTAAAIQETIKNG
jgi:HPt (histidine-containing phosphotransfer) domain-containing protein